MYLVYTYFWSVSFLLIDTDAYILNTGTTVLFIGLIAQKYIYLSVPPFRIGFTNWFLE